MRIKKSKSIIIINIIYLLTNIHFLQAKDLLTQDVLNDIRKNEHGFVIFEFRKINPTNYCYPSFFSGPTYPTPWYVRIVINQKYYIADHLEPGSIYKLPIPTGKVQMKYNLYCRPFPPRGCYGSLGKLIIFKTGDSRWSDTITMKTLDFIVKKNQAVRLKIVNVKSKKCGCGPWTGCLPLIVPLLIQDVDFEYEEIH